MSAAIRDWSLASGERQTSPHFADATASHRHRYAWAADVLRRRPVRMGADVFSGSGYGTAYLAREVGGCWAGFEGSSEAVAVAAAAHPHLTFSAARFPCAMPEDACDAIVSIESLEHVEDTAGFLAALFAMLRPGGDLLLSVPNEDRIPCASFGNRFHVRHFTPGELSAAVMAAGFRVVAHYGQRIHVLRDTAWGPQRNGRVDDAEQAVTVGWDANPCTLLLHARRPD